MVDFREGSGGLSERKLATWSDVFGRVTAAFEEGRKPPFDLAVVDEAQDIGVAEARFLATICGGRTDGLFLAGDIGQRIYQQPFSWKALGLDVRGRSSTLRVNYRTSHQIRQQADQLLPSTLADVDGNSESRRGTVSLFDGPAPECRLFAKEADEIADVASWIAVRLAEGFLPHEIGFFVRSDAELARARAVAKAAKLPFKELDDKIDLGPGALAIATMHFAKGLEFRAVAVMACDDEVLPLQERVETITDDADLEEVYESERHLLYVACTRARDRLLVTGLKQGSEFLRDFQQG